MRPIIRIMLPVLIAASLLTFAASTLGASAEAYPGSKLTMEVNLTDKDFLPVLTQLLTTIPSALPPQMKSSIPVQLDQIAQDLAGALAGLKSISIAAYDIQSADRDEVVVFYARKMGITKGWQPVTAFSEVSVYLKPDPQNMFALVTHPGGCFTVTTTGPIDLARLMKVAAQLMPVMTSIGQSFAPQPETEAVSVLKGTTYGSEGSNTGIGMSWAVHGSADVTVQMPDGKGGWRDSGQIATSPKDAPKTPRLIVRTNPLSGARSIDGYGTFEVRNSEGKAVMRLIVRSRDPKAQALDSKVRIVSFEPDTASK